MIELTNYQLGLYEVARALVDHYERDTMHHYGADATFSLSQFNGWIELEVHDFDDEAITADVLGVASSILNARLVEVASNVIAFANGVTDYSTGTELDEPIISLTSLIGQIAIGESTAITDSIHSEARALLHLAQDYQDCEGI